MTRAKSLADLMRAVPAPRTVTGGLASPRDREPGQWITSTGQVVAMRDMNPHHRENAIRKASAAGNYDLVAELESSRPEGTR